MTSMETEADRIARLQQSVELWKQRTNTKQLENLFNYSILARKSGYTKLRTDRIKIPKGLEATFQGEVYASLPDEDEIPQEVYTVLKTISEDDISVKALLSIDLPPSEYKTFILKYAKGRRNYEINNYERLKGRKIEKEVLKRLEQLLPSSLQEL